MTQKLLKSTSTVAGFTLLSRILGFMRDIVFASTFGAGGMFDAFVIAFKLPNFLRRLFAEGAFSQAFVPILAEHRTKNSPEEVRAFVNHVAGTLTCVVACTVLLAELIAPVLIMIFAPGFLHDPTRFQAAVHLLHIMFPYLLLIVLTALSGAILNTCGVFGPPAFAPVLLNIALIGVATLWAPHSAKPIYTLGFGVLIGGVAQLSLQVPFLKKAGLLPKLRLGFRDSATLRVMKRMIPALFGVSVAQVSLLVDNIFASFLPAGSISWLYYSDRLTYFPLGVIGVALATVVLPYLSRNHAQQDEKVFSATLDWALRCALLIGLPAAVGLFVLSGPLLATLFHHGRFNDFDVVMTSRSLKAFAVGLPAFMLIKVLASGFYSRQNIRTPVKIAAVAMVLNLVLNAALIFPLKHAGLALATSLAASVNAGLLWVFLIRERLFLPLSGWGKTLIRFLLSNVAMGLLIAWMAGPLPPWLSGPVLSHVWRLLAIICAGMGTYFALLWVMGLRWQDFRSAV